MDRFILEDLVARLKPRVGFVSLGDFSYYGDGTVDRLEYHQPGWNFFASAVLRAEDALASEDPNQIAAAALRCPMLERHGNEVSEQSRTSAGRRKGGKVTGTKLATAAARRWKPYLKMFQSELAERESRGIAPAVAKHHALGAVKKKMTEDGFTVRSNASQSGGFPSDRAIRKRLK